MGTSTARSARIGAATLASVASLLILATALSPVVFAAVPAPAPGFNYLPTYNHRHGDLQWGGWTAAEKACYQFDGSWSSAADHKAVLVAEMADIRRLENSTAARANLPTFYIPCAENNASKRITLKFTGADLGYTPSAYEIRFGPSYNWCADRTKKGCYDIDAGLIHELGHALALEHSDPGVLSAGGLLQQTRMNYQLASSQVEGAETTPYFGTCDVAGLQGLYGVRPNSKLSPCFRSNVPPVLTWPSSSVAVPAGGSVQVTVKLTLNWSNAVVTTPWYNGATYATGSFCVDGLTAQTPTVELWKFLSTGSQRVGTMSRVSGSTTDYTGVITGAANGDRYFAKLVTPPTTSGYLTLVTY